MPFLHTPAEVDAHELLGRYTLGIRGDHFARLDKISQDACITGPSTAPATKSEAVSEEGAGTADTATAAATASVAPAEEVYITSVPRSVLACMRRGVEAQLKLSAERSEEEAVWLVLDRKLRPVFYQDEDDAAGEENEELHREADAREDARHTWLATSQKEANGGPGGVILGSVIEQSKRSVVTAAENAGATTVAGQRELRGDLATRVDSALGEHDVRRLAVCGLSSDGGRAGPIGTGQGAQISTLMTVSTTEKADNGRNDLRNDLRHLDGEVNEAGGPGNANEWRNMEGIDASVAVLEGVSVLEFSSAKRKEDAAEDSRSEQQELTPNKSLEEAAHHVLSRLFVREEETPLGRCMTRSLAVLQEVTLRLCRGQRDVFSGLNDQTAYAILLSSTMGCASAEESSPSVAVATTPASVTASVGELGILGPTEDPSAVRTPILTGAGNTSVTGAGRARLFESLREGGSSSNSSSNDGTGAVRACGHGDGTCIVREQAAVPTPSRDAIRSSVFQGSGNSTGDGDGMEEVDGADGGTMEREPKVFGSWEEVHPASLGIGSQEKYFSVSDVNEGIEGQAHPASFRSSASEGTYYKTKCTCRNYLKFLATFRWPETIYIRS